MRIFFLLLFLIPSFSFAQKFEVSEMVGCSSPSGQYRIDPNLGTPFYWNPSFSNQLSLGYIFSKHLAVCAFYEFDKWAEKSNSFGVNATIHFKRFYCGGGVSILYIQTNSNSITSVKYDPSLSMGVYVGLQQKIYKGFYLKEQIGISEAFLTYTYSSITNAPPFEWTSQKLSENLIYIHALIGLSYHF